MVYFVKGAFPDRGDIIPTTSCWNVRPAFHVTIALNLDVSLKRFNLISSETIISSDHTVQCTNLFISSTIFVMTLIYP